MNLGPSLDLPIAVVRCQCAVLTLLWRSSSWACWGHGKRNCSRACCWILLGEIPCPGCAQCGQRALTPNRRAACTERWRNTCYSVINQCKKQRSIHTKRKHKRSKIKRQISKKIFALRSLSLSLNKSCWRVWRKELLLWQQVMVFILNVCIYASNVRINQNPFSAFAFTSPLMQC